MNNVSKILALVGAGALLPLVLSAKTVEQAYVDSYQGASAAVPVPLEVTSPSARSGSEGKVELTFVVNAQGVPTDIAILSATNSTLVEPAKEALAKWKFAPAKRNGEAVPTKVLLPMRFVAMD